jgi:tRNA threonylcarbamoyladenosine biosynthesis protein TsaE
VGTKPVFLPDEDALIALGAELAGRIEAGVVIELRGDLGAGKTTLSRGLIQGMGHRGAVKSPTYTLVEPYEHLTPPVYHFDLYRIVDPDELHYIGVDVYFNDESVCLIEWPEKAAGALPQADLCNRLENYPKGRYLSYEAHTEKARRIMGQQ